MSNADQEEFWAGDAGDKWVAQQAQMDTLLQPVLDLVLNHAALPAGARVLDVGSGTGASVAQAADAVGPDGHVTGLDISDTMLALARARLQDHPNTDCLKADAQTHAFEAGRYDVMISRFGVMFFADTTAAFANIARALTPGAPLTFAAWGPAPQNPYFMEAAAAAKDVFGPMEKMDRTLPGPFAFEDSSRITPMLTKAGLTDVTCKEHRLHLTPPGDLRAVAELLCQIGPAERALRQFEASDADRARLIEAVMDRYAKFAGATGVEIPALINLYQARTTA
ncbi:class I SAM-dependent methyltransferase [uncultured Tateyamaria sp.]|uniref:class I SAM-dependent methyltransferase n=1 Tax=uncultured Tateyamaria sp. TaxID=455651 RepID=UPI0026106489|nr:class I SAM-dependent methyltransferase [uncultured Tateyamaria sp.]